MRAFRRLSRRLPLIAALARDRRGVSAVEFALVLPFLAMLYMAGSDTSIAVSVNRKIHNASATIDDLVTQSEGMTSGELDALMNVTASLVEPYDQDEVFIRVTQVKIDANGRQTVDWTRSRNPKSGFTIYKKGDTYSLPTDFKAERSLYVIVTEAYFDFHPVGGYGLTGPIRMGETSYLYPRIGTSITCSGC
ncbi:TadE/TadG family type IV pilus assembly protein [Aurantimonas sp. VKM B-3413]|uniref:TadE/TadG family type IV pilus assembly protein n=1 Tax=Aurantimonas sp. VKM B-3413 TaxID=2779401 RepID=UPI001E5373F5|nr:TadE/TadG family type IV pilus assembly protein [Aurantimonas sp. VKM B-3413]MCB8836823.1 pilus assembly protein [Aurantimonas sp. VKM B-3413]